MFCGVPPPENEGENEGILGGPPCTPTQFFVENFASHTTSQNLASKPVLMMKKTSARREKSRRSDIYLCFGSSCVNLKNHGDRCKRFWLVVGTNPSENSSQNWILSTNRSENKTSFKPPPSDTCKRFKIKLLNLLPCYLLPSFKTNRNSSWRRNALHWQVKLWHINTGIFLDPCFSRSFANFGATRSPTAGRR